MLELATDPQKRERDRITYEPWGQGLTVDGYLTREEQLRAHPWAREGMASWLLRDERGAVLASCESFRMQSFAAGAASGGAMLPGSSYGIASVFTEPMLRGRGHATRMMSLVVDRLRELDPSAHASVLFSDVGPDIYSRSGYAPRPALDRVFGPSEGDPGEGVDLLRDEDVERALAQIPKPKEGFLIWPTASQIDWHLERERVYSALLGRARPAACGARAGGSTALWASGFKANELCILLLHAASTDELGSLLRSARRAAGRAGLTRVVCWECPMQAPWPEGLSGGVRQARDGALPMLCPLDPGVRSDRWNVIPRALWI